MEEYEIRNQGELVEKEGGFSRDEALDYLRQVFSREGAAGLQGLSLLVGKGEIVEVGAGRDLLVYINPSERIGWVLP